MATTITITTYPELEKWTEAFLKLDGLNLLFLVANPGTAKTACFKARLDPERHYYVNAARLTTFRLYKQLFQYRDKAIILDDVDDALRRSDMARLLMALCETDDAARTISWLGTESLLKVEKGKKVLRVPQEFETKSRVCIICNDWGILTTKFGALLDRGTVVFFDPDAGEMHRYVGEWFRDERDIYGFIGEHLDDIAQHSIRYYVNAAAHKRLGLDWKAALLESWTNDQARGNATEKLVQRLLDDSSFKTNEERIKVFVGHADGGSRRTWFNIKKKLAVNARKKAGA
jgi:hypothetical protein